MTNEQIKELNNEALLDELVEAYIKKWSEEAEQNARDEYWNLYYEVLRRMNNEV